MSASPFEFLSDGHRLSGFRLEPPAGVPRRGALLVFCHGLPSGAPPVPGDPGYAGLIERFADAGYPGLFFNFRGTGESEGDFSLVGWTRDLAALLDVLESDREPSHEKVVIVASSAGALVSLRVASGDTRIAGIASLAAPADFGFVESVSPGMLVEHFRNVGVIRDPEFPADPADWHREFASVVAEKRIVAIAPRPVLLLHGGKDETVPVEHAGRLHAAAGAGCELHVLPDAGHRLRREPEALARIDKWLLARFS